ncbi:MAG TPA: hypothetical protein V6C65_24980 [Allocoleopsis sp.]
MKFYDVPSASDYHWLKVQELNELLEKSVPSRPKFSLPSWLTLWNRLIAPFMDRSEPKITQKRDRWGNVYYQVYDPTSGFSSAFQTEEEVRIWLDRRYYDAL